MTNRERVERTLLSTTAAASSLERFEVLHTATAGSAARSCLLTGPTPYPLLRIARFVATKHTVKIWLGSIGAHNLQPFTPFSASKIFPQIQTVTILGGRRRGSPRLLRGPAEVPPSACVAGRAWQPRTIFLASSGLYWLRSCLLPNFSSVPLPSASAVNAAPRTQVWSALARLPYRRHFLPKNRAGGAPGEEHRFLLGRGHFWRGEDFFRAQRRSEEAGPCLPAGSIWREAA